MRLLRRPPTGRQDRTDRTPWVWATAAAVVAVDVVTKVLARTLLPSEGLALVPTVSLRVVDNLQGPFGLGPLWLIIIASIAVLVALSRRNFQLSTFTSQLHQAALGLVVGGGVSNLAERLVFGRTTDFLPLFGGSFNLADVAIIVGGLWWVLRSALP